ncbi:MAG: Transcription initiation factor TFIID subunit 9 [Thelocarpon superellum]|nr:MAG: Transcription initiation factor TFIID subunit 9 [Thelocarpon superellum]
MADNDAGLATQTPPRGTASASQSATKPTSTPLGASQPTMGSTQPTPATGEGGAANGAGANGHAASATSSNLSIHGAAVPPTSLTDSGLSKRPRDARLIHMILASLGITAYQERVPLQLLDFAYRYTSSTLQDAQHLSAEGYATSTTSGTGTGKAADKAAAAAAAAAAAGLADGGSVGLAALRLAVASRLSYQFNPGLPKEYLMELASERNRVALPTAAKEVGVRLPPERFCLTGVGWGVREEWESEVEVDDEDDEMGDDAAAAARREMGDGEEDEADEEGEGENEDGDARMEDLFGEDEGGGEDGGDDKVMADA